ncbi:MAG: hypothetical protein CFE21_01260 [Bacteroidetes bacterium B1(2017)]|nr:MAG: hypothetical protein CFE21_01260 [Bacteroidetes bacterium B1(2017)]
MNKYDFTSLVKDPKKLGEPDIEKLKALTLQFPYFSIAQNLLVKSLHNTKHYEYDKYLKQAALQTGSRSVLYNLVHDLPLETESKEVMEQEVEHLQINVPNNTSESTTSSAINLIEPEIIAEPIQEVEEEIKQEVEEAISVEPIAEVISTVAEPISTSIEEQSLEDYFSSPEPLVEKHPEPLIETISETLLQNIEPAKPEQTRDPEEIYEDEKLVSSTGKFVKFIPKSKQVNSDEMDEVSLIPEMKNPDEQVLEHFDITSLDGFYDTAPEFKSTIEEEPQDKPIESTPISIIEEEIEEPDYLENVVQTPLVQSVQPTFTEPEEIESIAEPVAESIVTNFEEATLENDFPLEEASTSDSQTNANDDGFLSWISSKEVAPIELATTPEPIIEPEPVVVAEPRVAVIEDHEFVSNFTDKFAHDSNKSLSLTIKDNEPADSVKPKLEPEIIIPKESVEEIKSEPIAEEPISKHLDSLQDYEVNLFLAPLYKQVTYNENLFEESFGSVYRGEPIAKVEWTEPFVKLKETQEEGNRAKEIAKEIEEFDAVTEYKPKIEEENNSIVFEAPEVKPKIADLPTPKIARDPGTVESILEKFMRENPSIARPKSEFYSPMNMAKQSAEESDEIVSETLAQIYTRQGLYKKAIVMYEKLGLHYPEKLPYFAGLISQIKSAHNID